ncbi:Hint domain-containing protein [Acidiphilium sp. C61]|jgi:hypothetical protein|uniref:Hint domain-containing protein n=1 Tax=Acidiphilium sp. C61 TaxID=1671485 RepID=UPI00157B5D71|nr:Hint domain-containing protein [Acidiphilium sp. C61]
MSDTITGSQATEISLSSTQYADPVTVTGNFAVASGNAIVAPAVWTIDVAGSLVAPSGEGIVLYEGGQIDNSGLISGAFGAIQSTTGRAFGIQNNALATIVSSSSIAVKLSGDVTGSSLLNAGMITAGSGGIGLEIGAASAINLVGALIQGGSVGVELNNVAELTNLGTIDGATGILVPSGQNYVDIIQGGMVSASSGAAISFASGVAATPTDTLTILPGATFDGLVYGGSVADLVFGGNVAGTFSDPLAEFLQFSTVSIAAGANWQFSGSSTISAPFVNDGTIVISSGTNLDFNTIASGTGIIDLAGGNVTFSNNVTSGMLIDFTGSGSNIVLNQAHPFSGTIGGFSAGDTIDITGYGQTQQVSGSVTGNVLTLNDGQTPYQITFSTAPGSLAVQAVSGTNPKTVEIVVPCFRQGTRLLTPDGLRLVETLCEGDHVITRTGDRHKIIWHGQRRVDCRRHRSPELVLPVLIEKDAFGSGQPCRDLYLSPDHAIWIDGYLIEIKKLINGLSIRQVSVPSVTYHHIELENHDVILAEMLPVETYLDCGNRNQFSDGINYITLFANFNPPFRDPVHVCAPVIDGGPHLARIRTVLQYRLVARGFRQIPGHFQVCVSGKALVPDSSAAPMSVYRLPHGTHRVAIISSTSRPAELDPVSQDWRKLGIAIDHVMLDSAPVGMLAGLFESGFHDPENIGPDCFRWTDGAALLNVRGAKALAFHVTAVAPLWDPSGVCCQSSPQRHAATLRSG